MFLIKARRGDIFLLTNNQTMYFQFLVLHGLNRGISYITLMPANNIQVAI